MERLEGKRAIVTGAGAGIGEAIAIRLSGEGARVALADLDERAAERVAGKIEGKTLTRRTDVTRADEVEALVRSVVERCGARRDTGQGCLQRNEGGYPGPDKGGCHRPRR
jgi:3-oxoacyl-[acyl-carrier protein] reductase